MPRQFPPEFRQRALRMLEELIPEHELEYAAIRHVSTKLGVGPETLRKWCRRAARYQDDEIHQILLHEVTYTLAGTRASHGPRWRAIALDLGYQGKRLHCGAIADELAPWVGVCPHGHTHYRYRKPARNLACGARSHRLDAANLMVEVSATMMRHAAAAAL